MEPTLPLPDPNADFDQENPIHPAAVHYMSTTHQGKSCRLIDNTGRHLPETECRDILSALIENQLFGFRSLSAQGGDTIDLARRESSHIQIDEQLYRLIVYRYEARIENF